MHFRSLPAWLPVLLLAPAVESQAQVASTGSPYSAFGLGDLLNTGNTPSAIMGGTGIAYSEPYSLRPVNPASYSAARYYDGEGLKRPVFDAGVRALFVRQESGGHSTRRTDAQFTGLSVGVPFGKGRWGLGLGITPFSDVGYSLVARSRVDGHEVAYEYKGSGGLNRVFAGVGHVLWQAERDSSGHLGGRLAIGANFDFIFGSIEQTRNAVYPRELAYTNTRAFSSLVLRAPSGSFGLHYSAAVTSRTREVRTRQQRAARAREHMDKWYLTHVDTLRLVPADLVEWRMARADSARLDLLRRLSFKVAYTDSASMPRRKDIEEVFPWRFTIGLIASLPIGFNAMNDQLVTSFWRGSTGIEQVIDTLPSSGSSTGSVTVPPSFGAGISLYNARWFATAEATRRDWSAMRVDLPGYSAPEQLRASMTYGFGVRFTPDDEGSALKRTTYRIGLRYTEDYIVVKGSPLNTMAISGGVSIPLNAVQTNSYFHIGVEYGQRSGRDASLLSERFTHILAGISITPWARERWFQRSRIQ
ncbi:MAG TPA: hypothetical protein PLP28_06830 [Flavobacteriales bacterium]|nr:hypothetical protein [Flavobacteriales bacterium]